MQPAWVNDRIYRRYGRIGEFRSIDREAKIGRYHLCSRAVCPCHRSINGTGQPNKFYLISALQTIPNKDLSYGEAVAERPSKMISKNMGFPKTQRILYSTTHSAQVGSFLNCQIPDKCEMEDQKHSGVEQISRSARHPPLPVWLVCREDSGNLV